ncbi:hypothetical protein R1flu_003454 [Riccia fluitans]|uniref:Chalcone-flavonone isomerase family protein n=1 Tax=Riccia fluitans TaxID=41844 RepID=A0ABD1Y924_9MARC
MLNTPAVDFRRLSYLPIFPGPPPLPAMLLVCGGGVGDPVIVAVVSLRTTESYLTGKRFPCDETRSYSLQSKRHAAFEYRVRLRLLSKEEQWGLGKDLTLIGGGVRKVRKPNGIELKVTVLGVYADLEIVSHLSKYRGLSAEQLLRDDEFIYAFLEAPVDIAARVAYLLPLTGADYASKSGDNTEEDLKAMNKWGEAEELALKDYREYFKTKNCPPGSSVYFTITRSGLKISHSLDASVPKEPEFLVKSTAFGVALLGTMFSGKGVSPQLRASCGQKMASLLQH